MTDVRHLDSFGLNMPIRAVRPMGRSRSLAMPPFARAHTTSYSTLIETMYVYLLPFRIRDIAGYLSKVTDFDPPQTQGHG